jgi:hypothetical protein
MTFKPELDADSGLAVDRNGNTWELHQQSNNLFLGAIIEENEKPSDWFVITKGVLEVM